MECDGTGIAARLLPAPYFKNSYGSEFGWGYKWPKKGEILKGEWKMVNSEWAFASTVFCQQKDLTGFVASQGKPVRSADYFVLTRMRVNE
jgi:hypothetical protein